MTRVSKFLNEDIIAEVQNLSVPSSSTYVYNVYIDYGTSNSRLIFTGNVYLDDMAGAYRFYLNDILSNYKWGAKSMLPPYSTTTTSICITTKVDVQLVIGSSNYIGTVYVSLLYDYPNKQYKLMKNIAFENWDYWHTARNQYNLLQGYSHSQTSKLFDEDMLCPRIPYCPNTENYPLIWTSQNNNIAPLSLGFDGTLSGTLSLGTKSKGNYCNIVNMDTLFDAAEVVPAGYVNQFPKNFINWYSSNKITYLANARIIAFTTNDITVGGTYNIGFQLLSKQSQASWTTYKQIQYSNLNAGHLEIDVPATGDNMFLRLYFYDETSIYLISLFDYTYGDILNNGCKVCFDYTVEIENSELTLTLSEFQINTKKDYNAQQLILNNGYAIGDTEDVSYDNSKVSFNVQYEPAKITVQFGHNGQLTEEILISDNIRTDGETYYKNFYQLLVSLNYDIDEFIINFCDDNSNDGYIYYQLPTPQKINKLLITCYIENGVLKMMHPRLTNATYSDDRLNVDYGLIYAFNSNDNVKYYDVAKVDMCPAKYYLLWQDRYGSFQSLPFYKGNTFSESFTTSDITNYKNEKRRLNIDVQPKWEINTGWLDEKLYPYYESIFVSPYLVLYDTEENENYVVLTTDKEYTEKTFKNQNRKMFNLKLKLELNKKQRLLY